MKIYLISDDEKKYYSALKLLEKNREAEIEAYHLHFFRTFIKGLIRLKPAMSLKAIKSALFFLRSFFICGENFMIAVAPYDPVMVLWKHLVEKNRVIYHTSWPYWAGSNQPKKNILSCGFIKKAWKEFITHKNLFVACVIKDTKRELAKFYKKEPGKITVIPHSVDPGCFWPAVKKKKDFKVLFCGRLVREKGLLDLVKVIEAMDEKRYSFGIIGDGNHRALIEHVLNRKNVKYYGRTGSGRETASIFRKYDVLLLPSYRTGTWEELFGIVILEAFASGLAVISTDCIGPKNLISHMKDGIIVRQRDTAAMIKSLEMLRKNSKILKRMASNGVKKARGYSVEKAAVLWRKLLKTAFAGGRN